MAAIFKSKKTGCGCSDPNTKYVETANSGTPPRILSHQCCKTVDLDNIYNQMVVYDEDNSPCQQCLGRGGYDYDCTFEEETGNCIDCVARFTGYGFAGHPYNTEESTSPHGHVNQNQEVPQCSKLVVFVGAKSDGSSLTYDEIRVYKSRKRKSLPEILEGVVFPSTPSGKLQCLNLPYCKAGNLERKCCCGKLKTFNSFKPRTCYTYFENRGCTVSGIVQSAEFVPTEVECKTCSETNFEKFDSVLGEFEKQPLYNHWMMTPCYFEATNFPSSSNKKFKRNLMAYGQDDDNWWFLSTDEFDAVKKEIAEIDPMGKRPHTILLHCEVRSRPIYCCLRSRSQNFDGVSIGCDGDVGDPFYKNTTAGFCGSVGTFGYYNKKYLSSKQDREQQVKIYGVVGFTAACGKFDFDKICDDKWEEGTDYKP
jgi:hypothetical protein